MSKLLLPPTLPKQATSFDCIVHGAYTAQGFNPNQINNVVRGIPIRQLADTQWMNAETAGRAGSTFIFRDNRGNEVGRAAKPSHEIAESWATPTQLTFQPSPAPTTR